MTYLSSIFLILSATVDIGILSSLAIADMFTLFPILRSLIISLSFCSIFQKFTMSGFFIFCCSAIHTSTLYNSFLSLNFSILSNWILVSWGLHPGAQTSQLLEFMWSNLSALCWPNHACSRLFLVKSPITWALWQFLSEHVCNSPAGDNSKYNPDALHLSYGLSFFNASYLQVIFETLTPAFSKIGFTSVSTISCVLSRK